MLQCRIQDFPWGGGGGGVDLVGGGVDSRGSYVSKILYVKNEIIWTLTGGMRTGTPPDPSMCYSCDQYWTSWQQTKTFKVAGSSLLP